MKKIDLGQKLAILANLGVILGIMLLVFELNQNRELTRAQLRSEYTQLLVGQFSPIYNDPEFAALMFEGDCNPVTQGSCEGVDEFRKDIYWRGRFRTWENLHYLYRIGLYDEEEFRAAREGWRNLLGNPVVSENWVAGREIYSRNFVAEVNQLLPD